MPRSGDTQGEKCRMGEKAVYLVPETLKEKECRMGEKAVYLVPETLKAANPRPKGRTAKLMLRQR